MYIEPGYRWARRKAGNARARQLSADVHEGTYEDFLFRHEREATCATTGTKKQRNEFAKCLLRRVADPRNLMSAIDYLISDGPKAAGPNGLKLEELSERERWNLARAILSGDYRPGPELVIWRSKGPRRGKRPIVLLNAEDRVAQRAVLQIIQPLLEPHFRHFSLGFRPGKDRRHALALAERQTKQNGTYWWIAEDVKDGILFSEISVLYLFSAE